LLLKNKKAEIFLLRFDKSYPQSDIGYSTKTLSDMEELEIEAKKKKKLLYYVIIDTESTFAIYNRVK
jgi:hypothetical protein